MSNSTFTPSVQIAQSNTDDMAQRMMSAFQSCGVHVPDMDEDPRVVIGAMEMAAREGVSMKAVAKGICAGCNHS